MSLSPTQFQELQAALLSAFPSQPNLKQMVFFHLNENLDAIVGGGNMSETVFNLIAWTEANGRTADLINGAREANGGNPALKAFVENFKAAPPADAAPSKSNPTDSGNDSSTSENQPPEVFVSYTWGGDSETIVDQLEAAFADKGITLVRDKSSVNYKDRIRDFMRRLGQGNAIIVVISKKYLESENCMFELLEIAKHGELVDRIFPIVLSDADIYKPVKRARYIKYWEDESAELDEVMRTISAAHRQGLNESINLYVEIRAAIDNLTNTLADMNALTPEMHRDNEFSTLIKAVSEKLGKA